MLRLFWLLGLLLLAACQQAPSGSAGQSAASNFGQKHDDLPDDWGTDGTVTESKYFPAEQKDIGKRMVAGLVSNCYRFMADPEGLDGCLRDGVVDTFDDSGQGRRNCNALTTIDAFTDCVVLGNAATDLLARLDSKAKIAPEDWVGRRAIGDAVGKAIVTAAIMECGDAETEASAQSCLFDWLRVKLAVPDKLARKCTPDLSLDERGSCFGQAAILRFLEDHVSRMPGVGI